MGLLCSDAAVNSAGDTYLGINNRSWTKILIFSGLAFLGWFLYNRLANAAEAVRGFAKHAPLIACIDIVGRLICHVPGLFSCIFYYSAVPIVYLRLRSLYNYMSTQPNPDWPFYKNLCGIVVVGIVVGFIEKYCKTYLPNSLIIDILVLAWSICSKPDITNQVNQTFGLDLPADYDHYVEDFFLKLENYVLLFAASRNIGMMIFCTGCIARPCKHSRFTIT